MDIPVKKRLSDIRKEMAERELDVLIIPGGDPHLGEEISGYWKTREWASGFTGSSGTLVVTSENALLWTDFRYWIQAGKELNGTSISLVKSGMETTPEIPGWIIEEFIVEKENQRTVNVGINFLSVSIEKAMDLKNRLESFNISIKDTSRLIDRVWKSRPGEDFSTIYDHPVEYSGMNRSTKLEIIRDEMKALSADWYIISSLDELCWLFNIRGSDIMYNPVCRGYAAVSQNEVHLFVNSESIDNELLKKLKGVKIDEYNEFYTWIGDLKCEKVLLPQKRNNFRIYDIISKGSKEILVNPEIISLIKSIKNITEINGFRDIMIPDGIALAAFNIWLNRRLEKNPPTEEEAKEKITGLRLKNRLCTGDSFSPISAFGENAALCHYQSSAENEVTVGRGGLYLLDSGGQYKKGTTDITRTFYTGHGFDLNTDVYKRDYTLVLKGHIALSKAVFPEGTKGYQLDVLARKDLWRSGRDYGHGTGHGVGSFLNVHEGPQSISTRAVDQPLISGMVLSNEPGIYIEGKYGIRIENLLLVVKSLNWDGFLEFETLTLYPYERELIDTELLSSEEIEWINSYHKRVYKKLSPQLEKETKGWLSSRCSKLLY